MPHLTPEQIAICQELLSKLEPGFLPIEIFDQVARLVRLPIVLLIPVKKENQKLQIGLVRRAANDRWWPNLWHLPGTVLRSTDTMESALRRLEADELFLEKGDQPLFWESLLYTSARGAEVVFVHTVTDCHFKANSPITWFSFNDLPADLVESEKNTINFLKAKLQ